MEMVVLVLLLAAPNQILAVVGVEVQKAMAGQQVPNKALLEHKEEGSAEAHRVVWLNILAPQTSPVIHPLVAVRKFLS